MFPWFNSKGGDNDLVKAAKYFVWGVGLIVAFFIGIKGWNWVKGLSAVDVKKQTLGPIERILDSINFPLLFILLIVLIAIPLVYYGGRTFIRFQYRKHALEGVKYLRILPSNDIRLDIEKVTFLTRTFGGMIRNWQTRWKLGSPWFRLRFAIPSESNEIGIYMAYPKDKESNVKDTIRSCYPTAEIHDLTPDKFPEPHKGGSGGTFIFQMGRRKGLPLASLEQKRQSQLGNILNCLRSGTFLDLQFAPVNWRELEERSEDAIDQLNKKNMKEMDPEDKARKVSLMKRITGRELTFHVRLSLWSNHEKAISVVRSTANAIETAINYDGAIQFIKHDFWNPLLDRNPVPIPIPFTVMTWTSDELANLFHIPTGDHWIYQEPTNEDGMDPRGYVVHLQENQRSLSADELCKGVLIGKIRHPMETREVRVDYEQLSKHFLLTGASGMGKSSLAVEMIQSILDEWFENPDGHPGFTIIDPAREIIPIFENRLRIAEQLGMKIVKEKIHHFNLSDDTTHSPSLNLLHKTEGYTTNQLAQQAATVLCTLANSDESFLKTKRLLGIAIQSLLEDKEPHTILGVEDLFRNEQFRKKVLENVQDPYLIRFWNNNDGDYREDLVHVLHRVDRLIQNPTMRRLLCQKDLSLNIRKYMDEGHIVMIDTFGFKGYELRVIVGSLINQYHLTSKKRPSGSKFHMLMIDEAQEVQIPLLTEILSEDRKYNLGIGLITRDIDQFKDKDLLQAIRSNIGMILSCGQQEGAKKVESLTRNYLKAHFLEQLTERTASVYVKSKRNQRTHFTTCVIENDPPTVCNPDGTEANHKTSEKDAALAWGLEWGLQLMTNSSEAHPIAEVDRQIAEYMNQTTRIPLEANE